MDGIVAIVAGFDAREKYLEINKTGSVRVT
jgi:hypothetical protein